MTSYKMKVSVTEWFIHILIVIFSIVLAASIGSLRREPGPSAFQIITHVIIVMGIIYNFFLLYRKKTCVIELDTYCLRYLDLRKSNRIDFTEVTAIERINGRRDLLIISMADRKFTIPLNIERRDDFLNNLLDTIEKINYKIEYKKENILNKSK